MAVATRKLSSLNRVAYEQRSLLSAESGARSSNISAGRITILSGDRWCTKYSECTPKNDSASSHEPRRKGISPTAVQLCWPFGKARSRWGGKDVSSQHWNNRTCLRAENHITYKRFLYERSATRCLGKRQESD